VFDCAINATSFLAYVEQVLVPSLRAGDVVVRDNLSSHKVSGVVVRGARCGRPAADQPAVPHRPRRAR